MRLASATAGLVLGGAGAAFGLAVGARAPVPRRAEPAVTITGPPAADSLRDVTPAFTIEAVGFSATQQPVELRLQVATSADFDLPLVVDTAAFGEQVTIGVVQPLPERRALFWRARATSAAGDTIYSAVEGPRAVGSWLRLIEPNEPLVAVLDSRRPLFTWSSAVVSVPPGPWQYDVTVIDVGRNRPVLLGRGVTDTTLVSNHDLDTNASYRWSVTARLASGDTTYQESRSTFVIASDMLPRVTLLYQNFPNPFPTASSPETCIWFDLAQPGGVSLEVYDLRGHLVRVLLTGDDAIFPAGRHGRLASGSVGCDARFTWDGRAQDGRVVPAGVYLLRLRAGRVESLRRMLFLGF